MSEAKKVKYISKTVTFGGKTMTLYSIDGQTWSSRKQELLAIKERQERDKVSFAAIKEENGETRVIPKSKVKPQKSNAPEYDEEGEDIAFADAEDEAPVVDYSLDEERIPKARGRKPKKLSLKKVASKPVKAKKAALPVTKKQPVKAKKKALKVVPKARATSKPKVKAQKPKQKARKKAA